MQLNPINYREPQSVHDIIVMEDTSGLHLKIPPPPLSRALIWWCVGWLMVFAIYWLLFGGLCMLYEGALRDALSPRLFLSITLAALTCAYLTTMLIWLAILLSRRQTVIISVTGDTLSVHTGSTLKQVAFGRGSSLEIKRRGRDVLRFGSMGELWVNRGDGSATKLLNQRPLEQLEQIVQTLLVRRG